MPTFVRLLWALALVAGAVFLVMAALVHFVEPRRATITVDVPLEGLVPERGPLRLDPGVPE